MQIVIDIENEDYKRIQDISDVFNSLTSRTYSAIKNGTPLPKGHGRLIDADDFKKNVCTYQQTGCGSCKHSLCCPEDVPTIIEADKESEEV